jgi:hypothetical protein
MNGLLIFFVQIMWSLLSGFILSLKTQEWEWMLVYAKHAFWQGILLSITAPLFFIVLSKIWSRKDEDSHDTGSNLSLENHT